MYENVEGFLKAQKIPKQRQMMMLVRKDIFITQKKKYVASGFVATIKLAMEDIVSHMKFPRRQEVIPKTSRRAQTCRQSE